MKKKLIIIAMAMMLLVVRSGYGQIQFSSNQNSLFREVSQPDNFTDREAFLYHNVTIDSTTMKSTFIDINTDMLSMGYAKFSIFGKVYETESIRIEKRTANNYSAFIKIKGIEGHVLLTILNKDILGNILITDQYYEIKTIGDGKYLLRMYDQRKYPDEKCPVENRSNSNGGLIGKPLVQPSNHDGNIKNTKILEDGPIQCNLRILIVYTPAVVSAVTSAKNLAQQCIDMLNLCFSNSGVIHTAELAFADLTSYTPSDDMDQDIHRLRTAGDGFMDEVLVRETELSADVVVLLDESTHAGTTAVFGDSRGVFMDRDNMFCVANFTTAVSNITFPHEIAHLLGGRHDVDGATTPFALGHGFSTNTSSGWRTVLAVGNSCCIRIPNFSNPSVTHLSVATGNTSTANVASVLNTTIVDAKTFQTPPSALTIPVLSFADDYADFVSAGTITTATSGTTSVGTGGEVGMRAANSITLLPGFLADFGSVFLAEIDAVNNCTGDPSAGGTSNGGVFGTNTKTSSYSVDRYVHIYPNPTSGFINIEYTLDKRSVNSIEILNIVGEKLADVMTDNDESEGVKIHNFDIHSYASGIYLIKLIQNGHVIVSKVTLYN